MFFEKAHTGKNKWTLYVVTLLIVFLAIQLASLPLAIYAFITHPESLQNGNISLFTGTNTGLALTLLTYVAGFFILFVCVKHLHHKNYLDIVTARKKFDWNRFFFGMGIWGILSVIGFIITILTAAPGNIVFQFQPERFIPLLIIALLFLPFQTAFEELIFRGYLMQGFFLLFKSKWFSFILTSLLFGLMHLANPEIKAFGIAVALPQYIIIGLTLGYIVLKDDGLELAIGLHFINNFLAAVTFTSDASALATPALFKDLHPTASYMDSVFLLICGIIFILICNQKYHFLRKSTVSVK